MKNITTLFLALFVAMTVHAESTVSVSSPCKAAGVTLELKENQPYWSVKYKGKSILQPSRLGLELEIPFADGFDVIGASRDSKDETWKQAWGKVSEVRNNYNELTWQLQEKGPEKRRLDVVVRAYGSGVAVRYRLLGEGSAVVVNDGTHFLFSGDYTCWSANGERGNIGPVKLSQYRGHQFPLTVQVAEDCYASILEASISNYTPISISRSGITGVKGMFKQTPIKKRDPKTKRRKVVGHQPTPSTVSLPSETSWRVILLGKTPGDLITSNVMVNLNPPAKGDFSWVKPGLAMWDWRAWGGAGKDGFVYNLDMASWRKMIDFASQKNVSYLVLDANWYGHEFHAESNPMKSRDYIVFQKNPNSPAMGDRPAPKDWKDPIDIPALIKYGKERNVGVVLYINDVARHNYDFKKTLATYQEWGAAGIKYGFMKGKGQQKVLDTREIVELCAEKKLLCDFHDGPVPPSGDRRTYPNYVSREFCHAQADSTRSFTPSTFCTTVFCNMLAGPLDMCNGFLTLTDLEKQRPKVFKPIHSTVVAECARVLITFSGLAYLPDTPESYEAKADLFDFISQIGALTWDETKILNGKIGEYITTARRSGDKWFIASCSNEEGAELPIKLDFLKKGVTYEATLYEDTPETHYMTNKEAYQIRKVEVKKGDCITAKLAPGGGHCIALAPKK